MKFPRKYVVPVLVAVLLILLNVAAQMLYLRADLTRDSRFSISPATRDIIRNLQEPLSIRVYVSRNLPARLEPFMRQVRDLLAEYRAVGRGNIIVQYIDPDTSEEAMNQVIAYGIPKMQFEVVSRDQLEVMSGYLGILLSHVDRKEVIPTIQSSSRLEYDLTSLIVRLTERQRRTVGFLHGFDSHTTLAAALQRLYEVVPVQADESGIADVDTLVVAGATDIDHRTLEAIDAFLARGGRAVFLDDTIQVEPDLTVREISSGLDPILERMGIQVERRLVLDRVSEFASFTMGQVQMLRPYAYFIKLVNKNFSSHPVTAYLDALVLPWASPLSITEMEGITHDILATTEQGWTLDPPYNLDPQGIVMPDETARIPVIAMASGPYASLFETEDISPGGQPARIVVVGDSNFADDMFVRRFPQNGAFMMNVLDALTLSDELIAARGKQFVDYALRPLAEGERVMLKFAGIWLVPMAVAAYAVWHLAMRARRKYLI